MALLYLLEKAPPLIKRCPQISAAPLNNNAAVIQSIWALEWHLLKLSVKVKMYSDAVHFKPTAAIYSHV